jgi:cytochrome bd-type quinol oxidase subunit 2
MLTKAPERVSRKYILVCLLLLVALLGMSIAAAAHTHQKADVHEGQCAVCMSCAQMVAVCTVMVVALLSLTVVTEAAVSQREPRRVPVWVSPAQRVRPPPFA